MPSGEVLIILLFSCYFIIHSLTASLRFKQWLAIRLPGLLPYYRLLFNALALLLSLPLLLVMWYYPGEPLWEWSGIAAYLANGLTLLAIAAFLYSLRMYDMAEFLGLRQLRTPIGEIRDMEHFTISDFHRFVRHPWYSLLLVVLWCRDMSTTQLLAYTLVSLYLLVGSRLEENKLIAYHGEVYRRYQQRVPGLIPRPWRYLSRDEAKRLLADTPHS